MKNAIRKTLIACAVTASFAASSGAMAQSFPDFTVNEGAIAGALGQTFTADKITGNYVEVITFAGSETSGTFNVSLKWNAGQFVAGNGSTPVASQLGGSASQYGLYALYQGTGTFNTTGSGTVFSFTPGGTLNLFADAQSNTVFGQPANGALGFSTTNTADDVLIATGTPTSGEGRLDPSLSTCGATNGINCGSFGASSTFNLTAAGSEYFVAPNPFYNISFQSGQLNNFNPTGTQVINGSLDVIFGGSSEVPEPATVAMVGLGLLGLGLARRRKQA
ncbi:flocculation-associated PEP-CTERM protein PepA [Noviherbaspirillum soli]|uniref:flocculation-associated PEP-CTERM protein PepA n=1 Tax=Noviherbaspirillum soli TaxID=1064518 RepID=UPI00188AB4C0|nr:flocculation-associated PEP-CTERM protein PepA [Noviherbaspirillum soli]